MTLDAPSGGGTGGYAGLDIDRLYQRVLADNPTDLDAQADDWEAVGAVLQGQADVLNAHIDRTREHWTSYAGEAYLEQLRDRRDSLVRAAGVANTNAGAWRNVAGVVIRAQAQMAIQYGLWQAEKPTAGSEAEIAEKRLPHDRAARAILDAAVSDANGYTAELKAFESYRPMPAVDLPGDDPGAGDGSGSAMPAGTVPGGRADLPATGAPPHAPGPQLQNPGAAPAPPATPVAPPPPGGGVVVPPGGGGLPPGPGVGPISPIRPTPGFPGAGPRPTPGPRPAPGLRPPPGVRPPALPGTRPGLPGSRPGTGFGPRPPQSTVRPVIGARPGSSGMAPTGPRGGTPRTGLNRPVIGARPGTAGRGTTALPGRGTGASGTVPGRGGPGGRGTVPNLGNRSGTTGAGRGGASKPLIGRDGVVGGRRPSGPGVRAARSYSGGTGPNRTVITGVRQAMKPGGGGVGAQPKPGGRSGALSSGRSGGTANSGRGGTGRRREHESADPHTEGGDYIWRAGGTTVPGVITGGDWSDHDHTPGPVPELRGNPAAPIATDEHDTVERLSHKENSDDNSELWTPPSVSRGVIAAPRTKHYDDW